LLLAVFVVLAVALSIGAINALVPIIVIIILIAAAAGATRGFSFFNVFGISQVMSGLGSIGGASRGTAAKSGFPLRYYVDTPTRYKSQRGAGGRNVVRTQKIQARRNEAAVLRETDVGRGVGAAGTAGTVAGGTGGGPGGSGVRGSAGNQSASGSALSVGIIGGVGGGSGGSTTGTGGNQGASGNAAPGAAGTQGAKTIKRWATMGGKFIIRVVTPRVNAVASAAITEKKAYTPTTTASVEVDAEGKHTLLDVKGKSVPGSLDDKGNPIAIKPRPVEEERILGVFIPNGEGVPIATTIAQLEGRKKDIKDALDEVEARLKAKPSAGERLELIWKRRVLSIDSRTNENNIAVLKRRDAHNMDLIKRGKAPGEAMAVNVAEVAAGLAQKYQEITKKEDEIEKNRKAFRDSIKKGRGEEAMEIRKEGKELKKQREQIRQEILAGVADIAVLPHRLNEIKGRYREVHGVNEKLGAAKREYQEGRMTAREFDDEYIKNYNLLYGPPDKSIMHHLTNRSNYSNYPKVMGNKDFTNNYESVEERAGRLIPEQAARSSGGSAGGGGPQARSYHRLPGSRGLGEEGAQMPGTRYHYPPGRTMPAGAGGGRRRVDAGGAGVGGRSRKAKSKNDEEEKREAVHVKEMKEKARKDAEERARENSKKLLEMRAAQLEKRAKERREKEESRLAEEKKARDKTNEGK
jgi:hypothetical protein